MNSIVKSWLKYQKQPRHNGPDAIEIEGVKIQFGDNLMAERKKKDTGPHLGGAEATKKYKNPSLAMDKSSYNSVIRIIKLSELERVNVLRTATYNELKRLGVKRDIDKAVSKVPNGSSQTDLMSVIQWAKKIGKKDRWAVKQLVAIDATICSRSA